MSGEDGTPPRGGVDGDMRIFGQLALPPTVSVYLAGVMRGHAEARRMHALHVVAEARQGDFDPQVLEIALERAEKLRVDADVYEQASAEHWKEAIAARDAPESKSVAGEIGELLAAYIRSRLRRKR